MSDDIDSALGLASGSPTSGHHKDEESSSEFIQRVRTQTSYSTLRSLIALFSVISGIGIVIAAIVCAVRGASDQNVLLMLLGIGGGIFGLFVVIAYQQASSLLIDIADTLIEQNRKKKRDHDPSA